MQDQRMVGRPTFECVHAPQRIGVARVGAEPVDGLGREGHQISGTQRGDGGRDVGCERTPFGGHARILA